MIFFDGPDVDMHHGSQIVGWIPVIERAFIMLHSIFQFHWSYVFSDILVVSYVLHCTVCKQFAPAPAPAPLVRTQHAGGG